MLFAEVEATIAAMAATRSRIAKAEAAAHCLRAADPAEVAIVADYLAGRLRQRRTGVGWASLKDLVPAAAEASLEVAEVDATAEDLSRLAGPGSASARQRQLDTLMGAATGSEQQLLRGLLLGELRAGAKEGTLIDAIARAFDEPLARVRRAVMLTGSAAKVAHLAATGADLAAVGLEVGSPAHPMLAAAAPDLEAAIAQVGLPCVVDAKLDGIRVQVHRHGDEVTVWSRTLDDLTGRHPQVEAAVRALDVDAIVLDGEALLIGEGGRPQLFQDTASGGAALTPFFFDIVHFDGADLFDKPLRERIEVLRQVLPPEQLVSRVVADDLADAERAWGNAIAAGQEGVVVKSLDSAWQAGRRGSGWVKVKPRHTFDLVVLAVEWGSGRRRGWLSNIHLGARTDDGFVMVGKTFKGMTDAMLAWQTERFLGLEIGRSEYVVHLRPEQVVEIAIDGLQRSRRYPGGVALRFARVLGYREDKTADEADTLEDLIRGAG